MKAKTETLDVHIEGKTIRVKVTPFEAGDKTRYRVSYDSSPVHIFGWDITNNRLMVIESGSEKMPAGIESAIATALEHELAA